MMVVINQSGVDVPDSAVEFQVFGLGFFVGEKTSGEIQGGDPILTSCYLGVIKMGLVAFHVEIDFGHQCGVDWVRWGNLLQGADEFFIFWGPDIVDVSDSGLQGFHELHHFARVGAVICGPLAELRFVESPVLKLIVPLKIPDTQSKWGSREYLQTNSTLWDLYVRILGFN